MSETVTVVAFCSDHRISTYRLLALSERFDMLKQRSQAHTALGQQDRRRSSADSKKGPATDPGTSPPQL